MKRLLIILSVLVVGTTYAQQDPHEADFAQLADDLARFADDDINYEELYENYLQLLSHPLDLNLASIEDLRLLNLLTETQIQNLINYRNENGNFLTIYELQAVPAFDLLTIQKILPLVTVPDPQSYLNKNLVGRIFEHGQSYFVSRYERSLQTSNGFTADDDPDQKFKGSPDKLYLRFRSARQKDYSLGFTAEKDAGEDLMWDTKNKLYGADYISWHAQIQNKKWIKNLIVGDFQYQFGQGLVLGNSFGLGKGGETVSAVRKTNLGFSPYTSVNEAGYMRGAAATIALSNKVLLSAFYSGTNRDATLGADSIPYFSSFITTGLHRNSKELNQRHQVREVNFGGVLNYQSTKFDAGLVWQSISFDPPIRPNESPYNQNTFTGTSNTNASVYANYNIYNFNIFAEAATSIHGGNGIIAGVIAALDPKLDAAFVFRKYDADYNSFYSNAFAENTTPENERGMYWGFKYRISRKYSFAAYADLFVFPWLKFRTYKPSAGNEFLLRFNYQPSRKINVVAQFRQEKKERNLPDPGLAYHTAFAAKRNILANFDYQVHENIRMKTRGQFSSFSFDEVKTTGLALMQDVSIRIKRLQVTARFALFDTQDFENRQYVYENDVWLAYSLPAYYGQGERTLIMLQYKVNKSLTLWLRYSQTKHANVEMIGSGVDAIEGNLRNDLKLQVRLRF